MVIKTLFLVLFSAAIIIASQIALVSQTARLHASLAVQPSSVIGDAGVKALLSEHAWQRPLFYHVPAAIIAVVFLLLFGRDIKRAFCPRKQSRSDESG